MKAGPAPPPHHFPLGLFEPRNSSLCYFQTCTLSTDLQPLVPTPGMHPGWSTHSRDPSRSPLGTLYREG